MLPWPLSEETPVSGTGDHVPVLLAETVRLLAPPPGGVVADGTLGAGGHAEALLEAVGADGRLVGIDRDPVALKRAGDRLARFGGAFAPVHGRHEELPELLRGVGIFAADAILFDLGLSSMQLDEAARGFSFRSDGPLDMRMDPTEGPTAAELLEGASEAELTRILRNWGEERRARTIARAIVQERRRQPLTRTRQLAALVEKALGAGARRFRIHPATRTFQALRIAVNHELDNLEAVLPQAVGALNPGGRLAVISFHSLEDRIVKRFFRSLSRDQYDDRQPVPQVARKASLQLITRKPITPSQQEQSENPRSRSAKLRIVEKIG